LSHLAIRARQARVLFIAFDNISDYNALLSIANAHTNASMIVNDHAITVKPAASEADGP